jgi:hypothetical protein
VSTRLPSVTEPSGYLLEVLREGADFTLYRGRQRGNLPLVLAVGLAAERPSPQGLKRLEHEYSLAVNSIPRGQPSRWRSRVTKGGRSSYLRTLAVSPWIWSLSGIRRNRSI